jgi:calcium/calmodulin-dependent protein kinase I
MQTRSKFALKTIQKEVICRSHRNFEALLHEINSLRKVRHENVITLFEVYESKNNIHLVLERLAGGELF